MAQSDFGGECCEIVQHTTQRHGAGARSRAWFLLQAAAQLLTGPEGKLLGVDYSQYMHEMASKRMKEQISSGKAVLYYSDVVAMPIEEHTVDKVFHCNCYYFWPDLKAGARAIHRVMKPGETSRT